MNTSLQFRVLYRQFLFRLMDVELSSASARGDASKLLGQFAALLVFGKRAALVGLRHYQLCDQRAGINAGGIGWHGVVRGTLPDFPHHAGGGSVRAIELGIQLSRSPRCAGAGSLAGSRGRCWRQKSRRRRPRLASRWRRGIAWPVLHGHWRWPRPGAGMAGTIRLVGALWVTFVAAGTFLYCAILGVATCWCWVPCRFAGGRCWRQKSRRRRSCVGLTVAAWNSMAGFAWPLAMARPGAGMAGTIRLVGALWVTFVAAGTFLYCAILGVQALAAQLPRRWYLRVSSGLQIGALILFLGVSFPAVTGDG